MGTGCWLTLSVGSYSDLSPLQIYKLFFTFASSYRPCWRKRYGGGLSAPCFYISISVFNKSFFITGSGFLGCFSSILATFSFFGAIVRFAVFFSLTGLFSAVFAVFRVVLFTVLVFFSSGSGCGSGSGSFFKSSTVTAFSGSGFFETFCCCSTGFNLRHNKILLNSWFCFLFYIIINNNIYISNFKKLQFIYIKKYPCHWMSSKRGTCHSHVNFYSTKSI